MEGWLHICTRKWENIYRKNYCHFQAFHTTLCSLYILRWVNERNFSFIVKIRRKNQECFHTHLKTMSWMPSNLTFLSSEDCSEWEWTMDGYFLELSHENVCLPLHPKIGHHSLLNSIIIKSVTKIHCLSDNVSKIFLQKATKIQFSQAVN